jgi:hypothetical protein
MDTAWWQTLFSTFSFLAAALAAHLWFRASKVPIPSHTGDSWEGKGPFADALKKISRLNANAAFTAAVAALLQGLSIASKVVLPVIVTNLK